MHTSLLPFTVFVTGACVLVVEVLAVRVLSPYYGNTIYTVSSVISVILLALSVGYYAGGALADRRPSPDRFFGIIAASGVVLLLFYGAGRLLLPSFSGVLSIEAGPLVSAALLFLAPALLLGTLSPYAVKLQSMYAPDHGVGRASGSIFFWSTLGSITGSLLAGFALVPNFGVDRVILAVGGLLVAIGVLPLPALRRTRRRVYAAAAAVVLLLGAIWFDVTQADAAWLDAAPAVAEDEALVYRADGVYQKITIYDGAFLGRPARFLLLDRSESGAMFLDADDPAELVYDYTKYYALYKVFAPRVRNALVLGGGAWSIPKALLRELPEARVDVAEIEPALLDLSRRYFALPESPRLRNHIEDGRRFLQESGTQYDLIFGDVYYSYFSVPPHFTTREFFALAKARLAPGGVFVANMIGDLSRRQPSLIMAEIKTFQEVFPNSYYFAVESPEKVDLLQNITLAGSNGDTRFDVAAPPVTTNPDPLIRFLRYKVLDVGRRFELTPYPVLTDDYAPVEYLTARVLRRTLDESAGPDGEEMLALVDQQRRYGARGAGTPGRRRLRDLLLAEVGGLAQEMEAEGPDVTGRFFLSEEERRVTIAAPQASASATAVLVDLARTLVSSPVPPTMGVDLVFFDAQAPAGARVVQDACAEAACTAGALAGAAQRLYSELFD
jgi:spermidine synthase/MFS family permease